MEALIRQCTGDHPARIKTVISPVGDSPGLQTARTLGVKTEVVPYEPDSDYSARLLGALEGVEWLCLAGYLRLLPVPVLQHFGPRVLNIHPALLPKFGGRGMYGLHVHGAVLQAGETESGCTVHYVSEKYDEGAILLQERVPVLPDDSPETLAQRVLKAEHHTYARALEIAIRRAEKC